MDIQRQTEQTTYSSRGKWVLIGFLAVAAYFLWTEHKAHVVQFLPYLLLLACPLMHFFHHGHGGHGHHAGQARPSDADETSSRSIQEKNHG